jgi:hypothetical protein
MAAPVEYALLDPVNRHLFQGRDAAALVVSRGAYQRTLAMIVRRLERLGANVVAARGCVHEGREPRRLMSLWFFLILRRPGVPRLLAEPRYGPTEATLADLEHFGAALAERSRTRPHWTLLLQQPSERLVPPATGAPRGGDGSAATRTAGPPEPEQIGAGHG